MAPITQAPLPSGIVVFRTMFYFAYSTPPPPLRKHCYLVKPSFSVPLVVPAQGGAGVLQ